ncbi:MAG: thermonuclease family protein [Gammaproteobacteria bacterium]|nr:thermonuclease family protein [Gammaproteobacteria bacterium]
MCVWAKVISRLILATAFAAPIYAHAQIPCAADRIDEQVRVSLAYDGDTVTLSDGRRVRLIGIDTPELGRDGRPHQPGALAARDRLRQLLFSHRQRLDLRFDAARQDKYGRLLAHAFFGDGSNLVQQLLAEGAGAQLVIPPNTWQAGCYQQAVRSARQQHRGVWALAAYQPTPVERLTLRDEGLRIVSGRVSHLSNSASAVWINLVGNVALRIERQDLPEFRNVDLDALAGNTLEAQGWLYARSGQLRMRVRHPAALNILGRAPATATGPLK